MAYKITVNKSCVNRAAVVTEIHNQLVAMGWTYVDGIVDNPALSIPYTDVNITNDTFTKVGHSLVNGTPVQITTTGTIPGGLAINTLYYIVSVSGDTFKLSATYGGNAINITSQGTGNHSIVEAFRIYSSNGEAADQITQYVIISQLTTNGISNRGCYKYDIATRTYSALADTSGSESLITSESGCYVWIHGDKNFVHVMTKTVSTYYRFGFGFLKQFFPLKTTLSANATSSANPVVLTVADVTGFEVGYTYQIVGANAEGRDNLTVTAIGSGTLTVSSLPRNYSSGAYIGINPCTFGSLGGNVFSFSCPFGAVGLGSSSSGYGGIANALPIASLDVEMRIQKYVLQPLLISAAYDSDTTKVGIEGYIDTRILVSPKTGMVIEDTFAVGKLDTGTSTGLNSTTVLNDTSKSWTVDAYVGKVVIIKFGLGSGMIKKILSNTATALTLDDTVNIFETVPDTTSQYIICDEGYRYMSNGSGSGTASLPLAVIEGI